MTVPVGPDTHPAWPPLTLRFGTQVDTKPILRGDGLPGTGRKLYVQVVGNYIAKYATKALDAPGLPDRPLRSPRDIASLRCNRHYRAMITTAWKLGGGKLAPASTRNRTSSGPCRQVPALRSRRSCRVVPSAAGSGTSVQRRGNSWRAGYYAPDGRQRSKSFARKADAERWLSRERSLTAQGDWTDPALGRITFGEYAGARLDTRTPGAVQADLKPKTWHQYQSLLALHVLPTWRTVPLAEITFEGRIGMRTVRSQRCDLVLCWRARRDSNPQPSDP